VTGPLRQGDEATPDAMRDGAGRPTPSGAERRCSGSRDWRDYASAPLRRVAVDGGTRPPPRRIERIRGGDDDSRNDSTDTWLMDRRR
jgi:hypothetical protein